MQLILFPYNIQLEHVVTHFSSKLYNELEAGAATRYVQHVVCMCYHQHVVCMCIVNYVLLM